MLAGRMGGHLGHRRFLGLALLGAPAPPAAGLGFAAGRRRGVDGIGVQHDAAAAAVRTGRGEGLDQPGPEPLASQLHQSQRGHFGHLVAGAVAGQRLGQPAQHQVTVGLEHHVDEVDDDNAADVAQPQLAHDLLGRLEVVLGDGLLKVATGPGELSGVDVDDRHRLGSIDHQRAT